MTISELLGLIADLTDIHELVQEILQWIALFGWSINALLDLGLHFVWASSTGLLVLYLTYYSMRGLWRFLAVRRHCYRSSIAAGEGLIWNYCGLLGFFAGWASHCWWDGLLSF